MLSTARLKKLLKILLKNNNKYNDLKLNFKNIVKISLNEQMLFVVLCIDNKALSSVS
jgi:hypothetical protein